MLNKWLTIAGVACIGIPLVNFLVFNQPNHASPTSALRVWTIPFAVIGPLLLLLVAFRSAAIAAGLSGRTANLTAGAIAIGQWFATRIVDAPAFTRLLSDTMAVGGLVLVLISLVGLWCTQGLRQ